MNAKPAAQDSAETLDSAVTGGTMELLAVITAMVFVACGAAALLLTTPTTLQSVANAAPAASVQVAVTPAERPFHERYPVAANAESIDAPTF